MLWQLLLCCSIIIIIIRIPWTDCQTQAQEALPQAAPPPEYGQAWRMLEDFRATLCNNCHDDVLFPHTVLQEAQ